MKEYLINILKRPEIFRRGGNFTLRDETQSDFYIDVKTAYGIVGFKKKASMELNKIIDKEATCIVAMGMGGRSLAAVYGELYDIPLCEIRDSPKGRGTESQIEAYIPTEKDKVVIIDDVYNLGSSLMDTEVILQTTGAKIIQGCVILARNEPDIYFPVKSILKLEDLL